jgi:hypothetical protein
MRDKTLVAVGYVTTIDFIDHPLVYINVAAEVAPVRND